MAAGAKSSLTDDPTWIIDPVDGTMNFVHSFPHSCISLAVLSDKEAKIGIIYNPALEQMYSARLNRGATLNGKPICVSQETEMSKALVMFEMGTSRDEQKMNQVISNLKAIINKVHG